MTHTELVDTATRWLRGKAGCSIVIAETVCCSRTGEIPDAIGWREEATILVECKTSRADFFADRSKPFRRAPNRGMGTLRYFMAPVGVLRAEEMPQGWGLLEVAGRSVSITAGQDPRRVRTTWAPEYVHLVKAIDAETALLLSCMNRVRKGLGESAFKSATRTRLAAPRLPA